MSFDINQQMEINLAHFYLILKQSDCIYYQDLNGANFEGKVHLIQPTEQKILLSNTKNLKTNEISKFKLIQFKELNHLTIPNEIVEKTQSKSEKKEKTFVRFDQTMADHNLEDTPKKHFDQFEAIKKFGLEPTYNEHDYTTQIKVTVGEDLKKFAEQHENELKNLPNEFLNSHILEERNLKSLDDNNDDDDEEKKYSSVVRDEQIQQFFNSNIKQKKEIKLIADVDDFQSNVNKDQKQYTGYKIQQQYQNCDLQKLLLTNFINALEGYKWQTMQPEYLKNKKEKLNQK